MALVAAVVREGSRIDTCRKDLTASSKNYPIPGNITRSGGKSAFERSYCVEIERIDRRSVDSNEKCFVDF